MSDPRREDRFYKTASGPQHRGDFQRDRDRLIHCSSLRRLAGVTQVVDPAEGHVFHNPYAVHDVEDFYRAGLVPLERIASSGAVQQDFVAAVVARRAQRDDSPSSWSPDDLTNVIKNLATLFQVTEPYDGTRRQRASLRATTSTLINRYVGGIRLQEPASPAERRVKIEEEFRMEIYLLKQLTWHFVILNASLAAQQYGKAQVIRGLFEVYGNALQDGDSAKDRNWVAILPARFREVLHGNSVDPSYGENREQMKVRLVADVISSMTDHEALKSYQRLIGIVPGSLMSLLPY